MTPEEEITELRHRVEVLEGFVLKVNRKKIDIKRREFCGLVIESVNKYFDVDINQKQRTKMNVIARQMYYKYMRIHTGYSLYEIGATLATKHDHATLIHAIKDFDDRVTIDRDFRKEWTQINSAIQSKFKEYGYKH